MTDKTPSPLKKTVSDFLNKRKHNVSPSTTSTYRSALQRFLHYLDDHEEVSADSPAPALTHDLEALLRYADYLARSGLSESTYCLYLTALGQWLDFLFQGDLLDDRVPIAEFQRLRARLRDKLGVSLKSTNLKPEKERRAPPDEVITLFLRIARENTLDNPDASDADRRRAELIRLRNVALLETLISTGTRISEALALNVGDLLDDQAAVVRRGVGKGDKSRMVFFDNQAWFALQVYLSETGVQREDDPLFLRHDRGAGNRKLRLGEHGGQKAIRQLRGSLVRVLCEELVALLLPDASDAYQSRLADRLAEDPDEWPSDLAKVQQTHPQLSEEVYRLKMHIRQAREITAHSFRHALATTLLSETGDLASVQDILGHSDPGTTRRYSKLSNERLRQVHQAGLKRE